MYGPSPAEFYEKIASRTSIRRYPIGNRIVHNTPMIDLPPGVTRSDGVRDDITLDNCKALRFEYRHLDEDTGQVLGVIVWRDGVKNIQPDESGKPLRDLRPGDKVMAFDRYAEIIGVEIYA